MNLLAVFPLILGGLALGNLTACAPSPADPPSTRPPMETSTLPAPTSFTEAPLTDQPQGIRGRVLMFTGDQMPTIAPVPPSPAPNPISTQIWIFSGKVSAPGSPRWPLAEAAKHPNRLGWVMSDGEGRFAIGLEPGEYTLLMEVGDDLYLNSFLGDGSFATVQVVQNQVTEVELVNTENAVF